MKQEPAPAGLPHSEMRTRIQEFDWHAHALGPPPTWSPALRTLVDLMLGSLQPMFMAWGPEKTWLYNDAFIPILGQKHPDALGEPALEVWQEARDALTPLFDRVFAGEAVHQGDIQLFLDRRGTAEEAHFAFSYSPARDESGAVRGLFGACVETTATVLADRRQAATTERQRKVFEQAPGFIAILRGPRHVFEFANHAYLRLVADRELIGRPAREAFPELEGQPFFELLDRVYSTGERFVATHIPVPLKGRSSEVQLRYLDFIYEPTTDEAGRVTGIFVEGHDVTDAHLMQERAHARERRQALMLTLNDRLRDLENEGDLSFAVGEFLGTALEVDRAGYGTVDPDARTITVIRDWCAPGISSLAGTLRFPDYGSYIEDLLQGETVVISDATADPRTAQYASRLAALSATAAVNMPVIEHDRLVAILYLNHGSVREWTSEDLSSLREVAERARAVIQRRRAEEELRALAYSLEQQVAERTAERDRVWRNSRDLLVVIGADGIFRAVNPAWKVILGQDPDEVAGHSFLEFIWPDDAAATQRALDSSVARNDPTTFENRYRHADGTPRWISWRTSAEGDLVYAYGRDVTVEKTHREALRRAEDQLRQAQKMEAVGQLTGGLAHDFNNLLAGISGSLELVSRLHERKLPGVEKYVAVAISATRRAAALTQRLLAFSRRQTLDPRPTDVNRLVAGMEDLIRRTVGPDISVEVLGEAGLWATTVDASQLENALLNLCLNARDAMALEGGRLTVRTSNNLLDESAAMERDLPPGQYISLCVTDTGVGMSQEVMERAFDPFFTTKPLGEGTGLGLSMVYGFARQSGGQVRIDSELAKGTTVCIYLPRHHGTVQASEAEEAPAAAMAGNGQTVLVIDDEPSMRLLISDVLKGAGYRVIEEADGPSGMKILESARRIDLLITDVGLPGGMNGRQIADAARKSRPALKVLFITGYAENAVMRNGNLEAGMQILTKPFAMSALEKKVGDILAA